MFKTHSSRVLRYRGTDTGTPEVEGRREGVLRRVDFVEEFVHAAFDLITNLTDLGS